MEKDMKIAGIRSEDLYPEGVDTKLYHGVPARKGTMAAVLANIEILESLDSTDEEKQLALQKIRIDSLVLIATGLYSRVQWKNELVQKTFDEVFYASKFNIK